MLSLLTKLSEQEKIITSSKHVPLIGMVEQRKGSIATINHPQWVAKVEVNNHSFFRCRYQNRSFRIQGFRGTKDWREYLDFVHKSTQN